MNFASYEILVKIKLQNFAEIHIAKQKIVFS